MEVFLFYMELSKKTQKSFEIKCPYDPTTRLHHVFIKIINHA
jgi:hypothetical protein